MTKTEFYLLLDEIMEVPTGTVKAGDKLKELSTWDSLSSMTFIAAASEKFDVSITNADLEQSVTVDDLATLLGDHIAS